MLCFIPGLLCLYSNLYSILSHTHTANIFGRLTSLLRCAFLRSGYFMSGASSLATALRPVTFGREKFLHNFCCAQFLKARKLKCSHRKSFVKLKVLFFEQFTTPSGDSAPAAFVIIFDSLHTFKLLFSRSQLLRILTERCFHFQS